MNLMEATIIETFKDEIIFKHNNYWLRVRYECQGKTDFTYLMNKDIKVLNKYQKGDKIKV